MSGFSRERLCQYGYLASASAARHALRRSLVKWRAKRPGRPCKVQDPFWIRKVGAALDTFSTASSWTCLGPDRETRRQVRSLVTRPTTILRYSPNLHGKIFFKQFRQIMKFHWPEYKPGRRKTDLCDHCECFRKKIIPRAREFLMRAKRDLEDVCPGYWEPVLKRARYKGIFKGEDLSVCTARLREVVHTVRERDFQAVRRAAPQRVLIGHVEGALRTEAGLHKEIIDAYDWHLAAAQLEQANMRNLAATLEPNRAYCHADFMEKLPIPLSGSETSGQFHGAQRKTLSVFAMYVVEADARGRRTTTAIILVSEILELSALFGSLCVERALRHVKNVGGLDELVLGFDAGNHYRSYENMYYFLYKNALQGQRTKVNYLVEKHGKAFCDSECFAAIRRWLDDFLLHPEAFADSDDRVAEILRKYARREMQQNPDGTRFIIETFNPPKPARSRYLQMDADLITRSYSWEAKPTGNARYPVRIYNNLFSLLLEI